MSPTRHIFHVGFHKTATSWFQQEFYPAVTNARYAGNRDLVHDLLIRPRPSEFDASRAREALGLVAGRTIICEEELEGSIHTGGRHGFARREYARRVKSLAGEAEVVIITRDLPSLVASSYRQYVEVGGTKTPEEYVQGWPFHPRNPSFELEHLNPDHIVALYTDHFGDERVQTYRFKNFASDPRAFCDQLAHDLQLEFNVSRVEWGRRVNRSYPARMLPMVRLINLFTRRDIVDKRCVLDIPGWYERSRRLLDAMNRRDLLRGSDTPADILGEELAGRLEGGEPG